MLVLTIAITMSAVAPTAATAQLVNPFGRANPLTPEDMAAIKKAQAPAELTKTLSLLHTTSQAHALRAPNRAASTPWT